MTLDPASPERILVVGPYAPYRDGIAAYVVQQVRDLRRQGNQVEVVSPLPSAAHHHLDFHHPLGLLALRGLSRGFDRVILHFHPDFYFPQPMTFAVRTTHAAALATAIRTGPPATLVLHEIDERWGTARDATGVTARAMIRSFDALNVHDEGQAAQLRSAFGADPARISVVAHGAHFAAHTGADRATARAALGLDPDAHVSLCIGFVAEHKGFDRAVTAFGRATSSVDVVDGDRRHAELHVVGSPSVGNPAAVRYAHELASLAEATPGVTFHNAYVADTTFDRWLLACDVVLLPYRFIWSSGVAERAALFDRPVIATEVGGLVEQLASNPGNRIIEDDDHTLADALVEVLTEAEVLPADHGEVVGGDWPSSAAAQGRARHGARTGRTAARLRFRGAGCVVRRGVRLGHAGVGARRQFGAGSCGTSPPRSARPSDPGVGTPGGDRHQAAPAAPARLGARADHRLGRRAPSRHAGGRRGERDPGDRQARRRSRQVAAGGQGRSPSRRPGKKKRPTKSAAARPTARGRRPRNGSDGSPLETADRCQGSSATRRCPAGRGPRPRSPDHPRARRARPRGSRRPRTRL